MHHFSYKNGELYCEDLSVESIVQEIGTPFYLYSFSTIKRHFKVFEQAFEDLEHLTCFSVKSNSNLAILRLVHLQGGGADIVSGGELFRALSAGIPAEKIVFSGVGKTPREMQEALKSKILMFNVESEQELKDLDTIAKQTGSVARIAIRINPDVKSRTHPYVTTGISENKFGTPIHRAFDIYAMARRLSNVDVKGVSCHIGSQLTELYPFIGALRKMKEFLSELKKTGTDIDFVNLGGGLGITYNDETPPLPSEYARHIKEEIGELKSTLILEPGRVIIGNAGILVTKVLYTKSTASKNFVIVDAGMNDLTRPALYNAFHAIRPLRKNYSHSIKADLVGPICETGDFFAKDRDLPSLTPGNFLALMSTGAYGFSMSSNYNSRPRPAEVMVKGNEFSVIRQRETYEDLVRGESIPGFIGEDDAGD